MFKIGHKLNLGNQYTKGRKLSKEHKRKISEGNKDKKRTKEQIKKMNLFKIGHKINLGCKRSIETKVKMSKAQKGNKNRLGQKCSEEHKKKIALSNLGQKRSEKTRKKLSESHKGIRYVGRKVSEETKKKLSEAFRGEKCNFWKGGIQYEPYANNWTKTLKKSIRERDNYICQVCGKKGIDVHHIDYNKKNCNCDNLITLCKSCHTKTNQRRIHWKYYFKKLIKERAKL